MDLAKRQAITSCGRCGQPEDAHKYGTGTDQEAILVLAALGGPCTRFVASDAAVIYLKHLAITDNRAPGRRPDGSIGKRLPLHAACGHRHAPGACVLQPGTAAPGPDTARRGAARRGEGPRGAGPDSHRAGGIVTGIQPAVTQLLLLAEEMRPDWDHDVLADALIAAKIAGWSWIHQLRETVRLMCDEDASPWDLKRAAADPIRREPKPAASGQPRNPAYLAARADVDSRPPLPEHR